MVILDFHEAFSGQMASSNTLSFLRAGDVFPFPLDASLEGTLSYYYIISKALNISISVRIMEDLVKSICQSKKNANQIIELLAGLESAKSSSVGKTIEHCVQVFRHFIRHNLLLDVKVRREAKDQPLATDDNEAPTVADDASKTVDEALQKSRATEQVDEWILEKYKFFVDQLLLLCVQHEGEVSFLRC